MSSKKHVLSLHLPNELHTKLKLHAHTEMRSFQKQIIYILEAYASEKKLTTVPHSVDDLDFVED